MSEGLFKPGSTVKSTTSPSSSSQRATLPKALLELLVDNTILDSDVLLKLSNLTLKEQKVTNPFVSALQEEANKTTTDNAAPAFVSTRSAPLDAFSTLDPNASGGSVHSLLQKSWDEDPELTLKIIFHLRSIHEGKSARMTFYRAYGWLYKYHPRTAVSNLNLVVDRVIERKLKPKVANDDDSEWTKVDGREGPDAEEGPVQGLSHGYYKDLLSILVLASTSSSHFTSPSLEFTMLEQPRPGHTKKAGIAAERRHRATQELKKKDIETIGKEQTQTKTAERVAEKEKQEGDASREAKVEQAEEYFNALSERFSSDKPEDKAYKALYIQVARLFSTALARDLQILKKLDDPKITKQEKRKIRFQLSMAAKWAPSPGCAHDKITNICTAIAALMYHEGNFDDLRLPGSEGGKLPKELTPESANILRSYYRRWVLTPIRRYVGVPETAMSAKQWDKINYSRVSATCLSRNKDKFFKRDESRFLAHIGKVQEGVKTLAGATLAPHELVIEAMQGAAALAEADSVAKNEDMTMEKMLLHGQRKLLEANAAVVNAQWESMVARIRESGSLDNCLALCDVSGSMGSVDQFAFRGGRGGRGRGRGRGGKIVASPRPRATEQVNPIFPAVALTLLLAQLAKPPFNNTFITFSTTPEIVTLGPAPDEAAKGNPSASLINQIQQISTANWEMTTNFNAVFLNLLLPLAVKHQLKQEDMVKRLFVFSDMQFNEATTGQQDWGSDSDSPPSSPRPPRPSWETNHELITRKYKEAGYEVPEIVYWNLAGRDSAAKPVTKDTKGVAMVSGFSGNLLKLFMDGTLDEAEEVVVAEAPVEGEEEWTEAKVERKAPGQRLDPISVMKKALGHPSYSGLVVYD